MVPLLLPTLKFGYGSMAAALMVPLLVPTDIPEMEPVDTVPALLVMVVLAMVTEPLLLSSGAEMVPVLVPTLSFVMVPWPAALMVPLLVPTDIPEMEPVDTVPALLVMVVLLIVPEPLLLSSGPRWCRCCCRCLGSLWFLTGSADGAVIARDEQVDNGTGQDAAAAVVGRHRHGRDGAGRHRAVVRRRWRRWQGRLPGVAGLSCFKCSVVGADAHIACCALDGEAIVPSFSVAVRPVMEPLAKTLPPLLLVVTVMEEMEPADTVPLLVPMVLLLSVPAIEMLLPAVMVSATLSDWRLPGLSTVRLPVKLPASVTSPWLCYPRPACR